MRSIIRVIDSINEYVGRAAAWLCPAIFLVLCYEVTLRYAFNSPTIWAHQTGCMLGAALVSLGWGYTHLHDGHVRIDIIYSLFSPRVKALIDVIFCLLLLFPLLTVLVMHAFHWVCYSWSMGEVFIESFWYPPAGPLRTAVFLGVLVFSLEAVARFISDLYFLIRNKPL